MRCVIMSRGEIDHVFSVAMCGNTERHNINGQMRLLVACVHVMCLIASINGNQFDFFSFSKITIIY